MFTVNLSSLKKNLLALYKLFNVIIIITIIIIIIIIIITIIIWQYKRLDAQSKN